MLACIKVPCAIDSISVRLSYRPDASRRRQQWLDALTAVIFQFNASCTGDKIVSQHPQYRTQRANVASGLERAASPVWMKSKIEQMNDNEFDIIRRAPASHMFKTLSKYKRAHIQRTVDTALKRMIRMRYEPEDVPHLRMSDSLIAKRKRMFPPGIRTAQQQRRYLHQAVKQEAEELGLLHVPKMIKRMTIGDAACLVCEVGGILDTLCTPEAADAMRWAVVHYPHWRLDYKWEMGMLSETRDSGSFCGAKKSLAALVHTKMLSDMNKKATPNSNELLINV